MKYFNRELSWIEFNRRVLAEGLNKKNAPLERFRFLSIVSSNFDEFFMVRMAALRRQLRVVEPAKIDADPSGMSAAEQLSAAQSLMRPMFAEVYRCLEEEIFPALETGGLEFVKPPFEKVRPEEADYLRAFFIREVYPVLTPLRFPTSDDEEIQAPAITNGLIYAAFLLKKNHLEAGEKEKPRIAVVQIPAALDRIVFLPSRGGAADEDLRWTLLDGLLLMWGEALFPGFSVAEKMLFRVHRDYDFSVDERRDEDFIEAMEEVLEGREHSPAVRMVCSPGIFSFQIEDSRRENYTFLRETIAARMELSEEDVYDISGPLNLGGLWSLTRIQGFDSLKAPPLRHYPHPAFPEDQSVWDCIKAGDILLSLPYFSFDPVTRFFSEAAGDPQVVSIKTVLYRTSADSPVIRALEQAALNGKHVTAVVELKARFDEERNITWAHRLEKAGVIVIYGLARLKIHAKISQVIRRENSAAGGPSGLVRYLHLSTGNYNDRTARQYSDLCLFTDDENFGSDATLFFNMLCGYSTVSEMSVLSIAPWFLKKRLLGLIERETARAREGAPGRIIAKMNSLLDTDMIDALYAASQAGVKIDLNVRGICTLVPGAAGLSENIRVVSIVDRYLEHSRIFYFNNGGAEEFFISSADLMPRNLDRRVELFVPIFDSALKEKLRTILEAYFRDNEQSWKLRSDGTWKRRSEKAAREKEKVFKAQHFLHEEARRESEQPWKTRQELVIRRSPPAEAKP